MLNCVKARALGKRPARKNSPRRSVQQKLVDLDEGGRLRNLGWRIGKTGARRHTERAKGHGLTHLDFERRDAARDFIQSRKQRDRVRNRGRSGRGRRDGTGEEACGQDGSFVRIHKSVQWRDKLNALITARP
jgi:hypothetical protein